jgi:hypothetical protein
MKINLIKPELERIYIPVTISLRKTNINLIKER